MEYKEIAKEARKKTLELIWKAQTSHIGSCFSAIDLFTVLFEKANLKKDELILSCGWKAASWYYFLWKKGIITEKELNSFCKPGSPFIGLVEPFEGRWGLRCAGGSMGIAFSMAVGMARAKKYLGQKGTIWVVMSDGEMQCGNIWESARKAVQENLNNLIVVEDRNGYCAMGKTDEILKIELEEVFSKWEIRKIDGHDYRSIEGALSPSGKPLAIIAKTIKGSGGNTACNIFENKIEWHYRYVDDVTYAEAIKLLSQEKM